MDLLLKIQTTSEFTARVEDCVPLQKSSGTFLTTNEREFSNGMRTDAHTYCVDHSHSFLSTELLWFYETHFAHVGPETH